MSFKRIIPPARRCGASGARRLGDTQTRILIDRQGAAGVSLSGCACKGASKRPGKRAREMMGRKPEIVGLGREIVGRKWEFGGNLPLRGNTAVILVRYYR